MLELNCYNINTALWSLSNIFQIDAELLEKDLEQSGYIDQYELSHGLRFPGDESLGLFIFYQLISKYGRDPLKIDRIHWFHGTRTLFSIDDYCLQGILPGNKVHPILFERIKQWAVELRLDWGSSNSMLQSFMYHKLLYPEFTDGPYAIAIPANHRWPKGGLFSYTDIPEIVFDFFDCYTNAESLISAYKQSAKSYIIEFWDEPQFAEQERGCVLSALHWCANYLTRGDQSVASLYLDTYDGQGRTVPPERIIRIESVTNRKTS